MQEVALVTGAAGFIGSHLVERLLHLGYRVRGIDSFTPYYDVRQKRANLKAFDDHAAFELFELDLRSAGLSSSLDDVDVVFHQAAQPGVRSSWQDGFATSVAHNVLGTQRLLEAARRTDIKRFVFASSSSVYGDNVPIPMREDGPVNPHSPYGVTKLSAEQLCTVYAENFGVPTVSLRYFTVYGPRQRPDMATHRLIGAALTGGVFPLYGDGEQVRDFTFVADAVEANISAATEPVAPGTSINVGGGSGISLNGLIEAIEQTTGREIELDRQHAQAGDVRVTKASYERAGDVLGWAPRTSLEQGIARQVEWQQAISGSPSMM